VDFSHNAWLAICQEAADAARDAIARSPASGRAASTGTVGAGGDHTLRIDADAEQAIVAVIARSGRPCTVVSEECGEVNLGAALPRLLVDPIDGSLNASRAVGHHAVSIAVADGPSIADVQVGFILDLSTGQRWWATAGGGAWLDGQRLAPQVERRTADGRLELLAVEAADPRHLAPALPVLNDEVRRLRALGAIALSLCHLAAGAVDAMLTLSVCRPVDAAAGQLLVRETGGLLEWLPGEPLSAVPLDCEPRTPLVAARCASTLYALRRAVDHVSAPSQ
jgi:myo-inositol-1(or 4)-monophosphatase